MGGIGSGRIGGYGRTKIEDCQTIDVNFLKKSGLLDTGTFTILRWTVQGQLRGQVGLAGHRDGVELNYRYSRPGELGKDVRQYIPVTWCACPLGGSRPYFLCPGMSGHVPRGNRSIKLYRLDKYFLCRKCHRLVYSSQAEGKWDRTLRRCRKIRKRLGGPTGIAKPFPKRPKGMWGETYQRIAAPAQHNETLILKSCVEDQKCWLRRTS